MVIFSMFFHMSNHMQKFPTFFGPKKILIQSLDPICFLVLNLVKEFWIGTFLSFYFKLGPKHMNLSLCPNLLGLKRTLKFLEMAALFHIHNCHRWVLFTPTCFLLFCLNTLLTTTPPGRKSLNLLLVQILQLLRWWFCCSNF